MRIGHGQLGKGQKLNAAMVEYEGRCVARNEAGGVDRS